MNGEAVHCQVVYRLLAQKRGNWRWLDRVLEAPRRLYNAALEERIDCYRKTGRSISSTDQAKSLILCREALPGIVLYPRYYRRSGVT